MSTSISNSRHLHAGHDASIIPKDLKRFLFIKQHLMCSIDSDHAANLFSLG